MLSSVSHLLTSFSCLHFFSHLMRPALVRWQLQFKPIYDNRVISELSIWVVPAAPDPTVTCLHQEYGGRLNTAHRVRTVIGQSRAGWWINVLQGPEATQCLQPHLTHHVIMLCKKKKKEECSAYYTAHTHTRGTLTHTHKIAFTLNSTPTGKQSVSSAFSFLNQQVQHTSRVYPVYRLQIWRYFKEIDGI